MSKILTVYLAGAIEDIGVDAASNWRNVAIKKLAESRLIGICPIIHGIEFDKGKKGLNRDIEWAQTIFKTDLDLIMRSDAILVNFENHSVGTSQELFFANQVLGLPSFVYGNDKIAASAFTQVTTTYRVEDLDGAITAIKLVNDRYFELEKQQSYFSNRTILERVNSIWRENGTSKFMDASLQ